MALPSLYRSEMSTLFVVSFPLIYVLQFLIVSTILGSYIWNQPRVWQWISIHTHKFIWNVTSHSCPKFNGGLIKPTLELQFMAWMGNGKLLLYIILSIWHAADAGACIAKHFLVK